MNVSARSRSVPLLLFLAAACLFAGLRLHWPNSSGPIIPIASRTPMPALTLQQIDGNVWNLADHRGEVVLINYWATWCEPCREELPGLVQLAHDRPSGLAVLGVSLDSGPAAQATVRNFVTQYRVPYPVAFLPAGSHSEMSATVIPTTVLIDKHGRIAKTCSGAAEPAVLAKDIAALLRES